jgi:hypothetical protein
MISNVLACDIFKGIPILYAYCIFLSRISNVVYVMFRSSKGGPYSSFAGHDASRALAMFQTDLVKDEHDDLSDLNSMQMESVKEWEAQLAGNL